MQDAREKNPDHWKGIFYINKYDDRIFLPKRNPSLGYTLNFGNLYSYVIIAIIIMFIIIMSL